MLQQITHQNHVLPNHLGALLKMLRDRHGVKQSDVYLHLPGWSQTAYSRIENDQRAPGFDQLPAIYKALKAAGVQLTVQDRDLFLVLAQKKISTMQRRHAHQSDEAWKTLNAKLAEIDNLPFTTKEGIPSSFLPPAQRKRFDQVPRREVGHLLGRDAWLVSVLDIIIKPSPVKVLVLQGPPGSGKTSELHRLAHHVVQHVPRSTVVLSEPSPIQLERLEAADVLEQLLGEMLEIVGTSAAMPTGNLQTRVNYVLGCLTKMEHPVVIGLDNAEHIFDAHGQLEAIWRRFLTQFAQVDHNAILLLASQEWPTGTFLTESQLISTIDVPLLSQREGTQLLQSLGLRSVSEELLDRAVERTGGLPLCLEWMVRLIREPFLRDEWSEFEESDESAVLARLLDDPAVFGGAVAQRVQPLLDRVLNRLTDEATIALRDLAVAPIPLGSSALKVLYQSPRALRELREASLLVAYPQRAQLLPMVAAQIRVQLSPQQQQQSEERLIEALFLWLTTGTSGLREQGEIVTALALLLLKHRRLLEAAQFIIRYGWLGFKLGHAQRIARFALKSAEDVRMQEPQEQLDLQQQCAIKLLYYFLAPFLGKEIDEEQRLQDYQRIYDGILNGTLQLQPPTCVSVTQHLVQAEMDALRFDNALKILERSSVYLGPLCATNVDLQASLYEKHAWLLGRWSEYSEEQGDRQRAQMLQGQATALYKQSITLLSVEHTMPPLSARFLKKRLARALNNLGYHLNRMGHYQEALLAMEQSIMLKEQGYVEIDTLADAYGEQSQILANLGRFREALLFDEKAYEETQRLANAGYSFSQREIWIYRVNRGCLYLRLGKVEEAEQLLQAAQDHIPPGRRTYQMVAEQALREISQMKQWRLANRSSHDQLDWRWVDRYRDLASFDSYWWWAPAGPFNEDEQQQWNHLFQATLDEAAKDQLGMLIAQSRERELAAAHAEQREPCLQYPAIAIGEVRDRIAALLQLDAEISEAEPNAIIRRMYQGTIQEELDFLRMIEATYERNTERYWECSLRFSPIPSANEMRYALSRVRYYILHGLARADTAEVSNQLACYLRDTCAVGIDFFDEKDTKSLEEIIPLAGGQPKRMVSSQAARAFFKAALRENGYAEWDVVIDQNASVPRVEQAQRRVYLPEKPISVQQIKSDLSHELAGHVARCISGEQSRVGLLGIHTQGSLEMEEGLATYYDLQTAAQTGQPHDETAIWFGTLATGLASGVECHPQSFMSLYTVFELFIELYRLLRRPDQDAQTAHKFAKKIAFERCIRTFRGVPDLNRVGVCYTKDALYLRGLWKVEQAVKQDQTVLDQLGIGVISLEQVADLHELGISPHPQPLRALAQDPALDSVILSFEAAEEQNPM